jgi:hypothetical protein
MLVDGHGSRISEIVFMHALEHNIDIVCIPAHFSHVIQPNDRGVNAAVKNYFCKEYIDENKPIETVRQHFIHLLQVALSKGLSHDIIKHAYGDSGIQPFNPFKILSKCQILTPIWAMTNKQPRQRNNIISGEILTLCSSNYSMEIKIKNKLQNSNLNHQMKSEVDSLLNNVNIFNLPKEFSFCPPKWMNVLEKLKRLSNTWKSVEVENKTDFSLILIKSMRILHALINDSEEEYDIINQTIKEIEDEGLSGLNNVSQIKKNKRKTKANIYGNDDDFIEFQQDDEGLSGF